MQTKAFLSRLMKMSWEIQRNKHNSRSKALSAAWAILSNEEVTIYFLTKRLNKDRALPVKVLNQFSLFNPLNA